MSDNLISNNEDTLPKGYMAIGSCYDVLTLNPNDLRHGEQKNAMGERIVLNVFSLDNVETIANKSNGWFRWVPDASEDKKETTTEIETAEDYESIFSSSIAVEGGSAIASAGFSASYETNFQESKEQSAVRISSRVLVTKTKINWVSQIITPLHPVFKAEVKQWRSERDCELFVKKYGTHFLSEGILGSLTYFNQFITHSLYNTIKEKGGSFSAYASANAAAFNASVETATSGKNKLAKSEMSKADSSHFRSVGDDDNPAPVSVQLTPIYDLLTYTYFPTSSCPVTSYGDIVEKQNWLRAATEKHVAGKAFETITGATEATRKEEIELCLVEWLKGFTWNKKQATTNDYNNQQWFWWLNTIPSGYYLFGDYSDKDGKSSVTRCYAAKDISHTSDLSGQAEPPLKTAVDAVQKWGDYGSSDPRHRNNPDIAVWQPTAPKSKDEYEPIGFMLYVGSYSKPVNYARYATVRSDLLTPAGIGQPKIWDDSGSGADSDVSFWPIVSLEQGDEETGINPGVFYSHDKYDIPPTEVGGNHTVQLLRKEIVRFWPEGDLICSPQNGIEGPPPEEIVITFPNSIQSVSGNDTSITVKDATDRSIKGTTEQKGNVFTWKPDQLPLPTGSYTVTLPQIQLTYNQHTDFLARPFEYTFHVEPHSKPQGVVSTYPNADTSVRTPKQVMAVFDTSLALLNPEQISSAIKVTKGGIVIAGNTTRPADDFTLIWEPSQPLAVGTYSVTVNKVGRMSKDYGFDFTVA